MYICMIIVTYLNLPCTYVHYCAYVGLFDCPGQETSSPRAPVSSLSAPGMSNHVAADDYTLNQTESNNLLHESDLVSCIHLK